MSTYNCSVRVVNSGGIGTMVVWVQVQSQCTIAAKSQLEALYGRGNVIGVPMLVH